VLEGGFCPICDARMSSPPHVCLRWLEVIGDERGSAPHFAQLPVDHETNWRLDHIDGPQKGTL
jgi:hypothetical protein